MPPNHRVVTCVAAVLLTLLAGAPPAPAAPAERPSVLICSPNGTGGLVGSRFLDLQYLRELKGAGFEPDYLDSDRDFSWDRIRQYNVIVIYNCPPAKPGPKGRRPTTGVPETWEARRAVRSHHGKD